MQISLDQPDSPVVKTLLMTHRDEKTLWDASEYSRVGRPINGHSKNYPRGPNALFTEINQYFAHLDMGRQDQIWAALSEIHKDLRRIEDPKRLFNVISQHTAQLYELMPFDDLKQYFRFHGTLVVPGEVRQTMGDTDKPEQTYLVDDYYDLMVLTIALRPMIGVFGEFISRVETYAGTQWKISMTMRLLGRSPLVMTRAFQRLEQYVHYSIPRNARGHIIDHAAVAGGLSSDELPEWLLAMAVVKRLCISDVVSPDGKASLITKAWHQVTNHNQHMYRPFDGPITPKNTGSNGATPDDEISFAESYRLNTEVSEGAIQNNITYIQNIAQLADRVDYTLPPELLNDCLETVDTLGLVIPRSYQTTLCQWVLSPAVTPRAIPGCEQRDQISMLAATQALLWHWGFYSLAALCTAQPVEVNTTMQYNAINRLTKPLNDAMTAMYPFSQRNTSKRKKPENVALATITRLVDTHMDKEFLVYPPDGLREHLSELNVDDVSTLPSDIKLQLAELLIKLETLD